MQQNCKMLAAVLHLERQSANRVRKITTSAESGTSSAQKGDDPGQSAI
jgi:hypothetical protein